MSYTTFAQSIEKVTFEEETDQYLVEVKVENQGDKEGKCSVLVYAQTPYGEYEKKNEVEKSAIQFVGYEKTAVIAPGESETVSVPVDRYLLASYDQEGAKGYILSAGDTYFAVGESSHDALNHILDVQGYEGMYDQDGNAYKSDTNTGCVFKIEDGSVPSSGGQMFDSNKPYGEIYRFFFELFCRALTQACWYIIICVTDSVRY